MLWQNVLVSELDSASKYNVITDQIGHFILQGESISAIRVESSSTLKELNARIENNVLTIQGPNQETVNIILADAAGVVYWSQKVTLASEVVQMTLPEDLSRRNYFLKVHSLTGYDATIPLVSRGALPLIAFPFKTISFKKEGFQDTLFTMQADVETNVTVVMRDTTSELASCPAQVLSPGDHNQSISINGVNRNFILHVPSSYQGDKAVPLVVDFHPLGGSGSSEFNSSPYKAMTDLEGVITAYPDGKAGPMGGAWDVGPCCSDADDTTFVRKLVAEVKQKTCIDPKRVYAVGFSMGGGMSHYVACHEADIFAAVAPAAFDLLKENQDACKPSRPITVISFRSTGDGVVNYNGGYSPVVQGMPITFLGAKETFKKWSELNQCSGNPSNEDSNGCSTYSNCADGVQVTLCTKQGGGHDYGNASVGWPLLKKYTLP